MTMIELILRAFLAALSAGLFAAAVGVALAYVRVLAFERRREIDWAKQRAAHRKFMMAMEGAA